MKKKLSNEEVISRTESIKRRHASDWATLVHDALIGRTVTELAELIGFTQKHIREAIHRYAVESACGTGLNPVAIKCYEGTARSHSKSATANRLQDQLSRLISDNAPDEPNEEYVEEYISEGHDVNVAKILARSYEAAERALVQGKLRVAVNGKANINLPQSTEWELKLRRICSDVRAAAMVLDSANIKDLKRASTKNKLREAHDKWMEQMERIDNFHPGFLENDEVLS